MVRILQVVVLVVAFAATLCAQMDSTKSKDKSTSDSAAEQRIADMEKALWEAWKNHNAEPFKKDMPAESVNVSSGGVTGTDQVVQNMTSGDCKVSSYSLSDTKFTWYDKDAVMMTYKANQDAVCKGEKIPETVWASSLWMKQGGQWKAAFHQETPAQSSLEKKTE
jgi:hypothetical protein